MLDPHKIPTQSGIGENWMIAQPSSGLVLSLNTPTYAVTLDLVQRFWEKQPNIPDLAHQYGYRLDNFNLGNFFYPSSNPFN